MRQGLRAFAILLWLIVGALPVVGQLPPASPASAYIQALAIDPHDANRLYAASPGGGLYRTDDGGDFWHDIGPAPTGRHFTAVVPVASRDGLLFAGGEGGGLWMSPDRGDSWRKTAFPGNDVLDIAVSGQAAETIFVLSPEGVYRTRNGADGDWRLVFDYVRFINDYLRVPWPEPEYGIGLTRFQRLTIDPRRPETVFVGARWEGGYHRSDDGGETWRHGQLGPIFRRADRIQCDPRDPRVLLASTHHQGLFKSWNDGRSWVSRSQGLKPQRRTPHYGAVLLSGLAFDPQNAAVMYSGSDYSNWKSTDGGEYWAELGVMLTCEFARSFAVSRNPATGETVIYAGTNIGLYRSRDGGRNWESCNRGLPPRRLLRTVQGSHRGTTYEFALTDGVPAVYRRAADRAGDWLPVSWQLHEPGTDLRYLPDRQTLEVITPSGVRRSGDGGLRWDIDLPSYAEMPPENPALPASDTADVNGCRALRVAIHGAPRPDDALVDPMYRRPPFVYLAIVERDYPKNGSVPRWEQAWHSELAGTLRVPAGALDGPGGLCLYVEVRDFQYGTRTGRAPLNFGDGTIVETGL